MALTSTLIADIAAMAGDDYKWKGVAGCGRPSGARVNGATVREGMRMWLWSAQGGLCPTCGNAIPNPMLADLAHVVGSGPKRAGWVAGNIYLSHPSCNVAVARAEAEGEPLADASDMDRAIALIAAWMEAEKGATTATNEYGYNLTLSVSDFKRADIIATEWPVATVGKFIQFSPLFNYSA